MTQLHLVAVLVRVFAAYIVVSTLKAAPSYWSGIAPMELDGVNEWAGFVLLAGPLLASVLLWAFHLSVAKCFFVSGAGSEEIHTGFVDVEATLFSVVGLWFVSAGIIDLAYFLSLIHITTAPNWSLGLFGPEQKANFAATWVELVLGLFLLFCGRSFKAFISNIRG